MAISINVSGSQKESTGYATHIREITSAFRRLGIEANEQSKNVFELVINQPFFWATKAHTNNVIGYGVFEGSKIHPFWTICSNKPYVKQIWVPSQHVKNAFINGGVTKDIVIVPHGVDTTLFNPNGITFDKNEDIFTFYFCGGWAQGSNDRKGLDVALKAFNEEFAYDEKVRFTAKVNISYNKTGYSVEDQLKKVGVKLDQNITLLLDDLNYDSLPSIYRSADVFVLPTRCEGFGLTAIESMACGVPAITTNYGGQTDFVNNTNGWLITEGEMKPASTFTDNIFSKEAMWFDPSIDQLRKLMRHTFENRSEVRQKSKYARETAEKYTWDNTAKIGKDELEKLSNLQG